MTSFIHVKDAAKAAVLALNWQSGTINIVDDEPAKSSIWLPYYAEVMGAPLPIKIIKLVINLHYEYSSRNRPL